MRGQFNAPPLPALPPEVPEWFRAFYGRLKLTMNRIAEAVPGPVHLTPDASAGTSTLLLYGADLVSVALTRNTTLTLDTATRAGAFGQLELTQDATGGRTVTFVNALTTPAISTTALKRTLIGATYTGTGWVLRTLASGY